MAASLGHVLAQIQRWTSPHLEEISDAMLLERFAQCRDESAFAALVARHGPMVLRSCRRILGDVHAAEDAFQATFLILARKAHALKQPAALPGWLHGVARRVALKARTKAAVHTKQMPLSEDLLDGQSDPLARLTARELLTVLDEEVGRLPAAQRSAVVMCCLEGRTQEEAARQLGWTPGSLKGHLERGRRRLQDRLARRGITLSAGLALVAVSRGEAIPALLLRSTTQAVLSGGISSSATALAHSVLKTMFLGKLADAVTVALTLVLAASITVALVYRGSTTEPSEDKTPALPVAPKNAGTSKPSVRTDALGDPLPPRAVARLGSLRFYHGMNADRVTLSADGKWVVSTGTNGNRLWETATGRERPIRKELRAAVIFAVRNKLVAVERREGGLQLWDVIAGKEVGRPLAAKQFLSSLCLSPDGKTLVAWHWGLGEDPTLRFYDVDKAEVGELIKLKKVKQVSQLAFSADSKTLVLQCDHSTIQVWDVARRKEKLRSPPNIGDYGGFIALSPDGTILATAAPFAGKRIRLWDTRTLKELPPLLNQPKETVQPMTFSPDGKLLVATYASPLVYLWDATTRKEKGRIKADFQIRNTSFSADSKTLACADHGWVRLWDVEKGEFRRQPQFGHTYCVDSIAFSPDDKRLVSGAGYSDEIVRIWDPLTGKTTAQLRGHTTGIEAVAYSPDGKLIASGSQDGTVRLWDAATGRLVRSLKAKDGMVYGMAFAPDGKTLASSGWRKAVHLWDVAAGRELRSFTNPGGLITRLVFSPDGKWIATRGSDIRIWDAANGQQIRRLEGPAAGWGSLAFSPDGTMLAAGGDGAAVHFWNVRSGVKLRTFADSLQPGQSNRVLSVTFAPDGRSLAAGYDDATVRLWELASGRERLRFEGHHDGSLGLAFSPDCTLLASGGSDRIIMVWDITGQRTEPLPRKARLTNAELNALWRDLADDDAAKAYRAMQMLLAAGEQAVMLLKQRLLHASAVDVRHIERLIADLDSEQFTVRDKAERELRKVGEDAEPALRKILAGKPSAEQRLRVKRLLQEIDAARAPERLRQVRSMEVLERLGSVEAQQVLKLLAEGDPQARLTREAKAALRRSAKRGGNGAP